VLLDDLLVLGNYFLQSLGVEIGVQLRLLLLFLAVEDVLEFGFLNVEDDVAEHLNQAAIGVVGEARILRARGQRLDALIVEAEVENGVHHARHGELCAGAHRDQQRIITGAELLPLELFEVREGLVHLPVNVLADRAAHVLAAGLGLDGESGRYGKTGVGHLGQTGALAAENLFHLAVALGLAAAEGIDVLHCADCGSRHSLTL
jgi:hypothetical protein